MGIIENIKIAIRSIRSNFLRALLTLMIIAVGIACLVGILTAIDTMLFSMSDSFNRMGANSLQIRPSRSSNVNGKKVKRGDPITFRQAMDFKENYKFSGANVSINTFCKWNSVVKFANKKTNPNIRTVGIDENYLSASAYELEAGRNFTQSEIESGSHLVIIGAELVKLLFDDEVDKAIQKVVSVGNTRYKVIGVLKSKGATMTASNDKRIFIPLFNAKRYYGYANKNYSLMAAMNDTRTIDDAASHAIGVMRNIRKLKAKEPNDFTVTKSDGMLQNIKEQTSTIRLGTVIIALMSLLGAAIGLMNIMLVSVTERTREIGVRKALGASRKTVLIQFLVEAIVITLLGGLCGIFLGILLGGSVAFYFKTSFVFPFNWMTLALIVCVFVGVVAGLYPAIKASRLDPIEALRYE